MSVEFIFWYWIQVTKCTFCKDGIGQEGGRQVRALPPRVLPLPALLLPPQPPTSAMRAPTGVTESEEGGGGNNNRTMMRHRVHCPAN